MVVVVFVVVFFLGFSVSLFLPGIILLLSGDVESNPGPARCKFCNLLYCNIRGLYGNLNELSLASAKYDIICCSETLVSDRRHYSELLLPNFNTPVQLQRNSLPRAQGL